MCSYINYTYTLLIPQQLTGALPSLSDTVSTRDCGFEVLMWWASLGVVTCQWTSGKDSGTSEHYPVIEDLPENRYFVEMRSKFI